MVQLDNTYIPLSQKFNIFHEEIETSLYKNINIFLYEWYKAPKSNALFMLLITCGRTILFIFQESTNKVSNAARKLKSIMQIDYCVLILDVNLHK